MAGIGAADSPQEDLVPFRDQETGERIFLPRNLTSDQQREMLERFRQQLGERRETRIQSREQSLEAQLGAPLARTPEGSLAEFERPMARFDVAKTTTTEGRIEKLKSKFPDMEVRAVDDPEGGQLIGLRAPGERDFTLLDSDELFTLSDAAELGGDLFSLETLSSVLATVRSKGMNVLGRTAFQIGGAFAGRAGDLAIEQARGYEKRSLEQLAGDATVSGAFAGAGELLFAPLRLAGQTVAGRSAIQLTPEEIAAQETARRGAVGGLSVGQVNPLARRMEQQAAATSKVVQTQRLDQMAGALQDMRAMREAADDFTSLDTPELDRIIQRFENDILTMINVPPVDPAKGGRALKAGRQEYVQAAKAHIGRKYDAAIAASEGINFDISNAVNLAQQLKAGIQSIGADGKPVRITIDPEGQLGQLVDTLSRLDPNVAAFDNVSGFEQVKTLRSQFFDLKNAVMPGQERPDNRMAGQLWDALTEAMNSPLGEGSDEFKRLYRAASIANAKKEAILEAADMRIIAQTTDFDTERLVRHVASPGNGTILRTMARVMPAEQFDQFKQAFKSDLMAQPENIVARLNQFRQDPRALRILLTPDEQTTLRQIGLKMREFNSAPFRSALEDMADIQQRSMMIARKADNATLAEFIEKAGGKNSPGGKAMRAGMFENILSSATRIERGREVLDVDQAIKSITNLEETGKLRTIFTADEVDFLKSNRAMFSFLETTADPGASIQAAEIGADIASIVTTPVRPVQGPLRFFRGVTAAVRNAIIGRLFTNPRSRQLILGAGQRPLDFTALRAAAVITSEMVADVLDARTKKEEQ